MSSYEIIFPRSFYTFANFVIWYVVFVVFGVFAQIEMDNRDQTFFKWILELRIPT